MNVIVIPLYGIGDVLMTTPALKILKEQYPEIQITVVCMFKNNYDILKNNPNIDTLIFFPFLEKGKDEALRFLLSFRGRFDCSINFYPSNRKEYNIFAYLIGAKRRIGNRYLKRNWVELNFLKNCLIDEDPKLHNVEENVRLLSFLGIKMDKIPQMEVFLTEEEIEKGRKLIGDTKRGKRIGIHAGTSSFKGHVNKRWPKERFVELINKLDAFSFYIFGGSDDREVNEFILKNTDSKERVILLQGLPIREVASAMMELDLFVSNDSGLMHLAASVGVPVVALFGPTNPDFVRPWGVMHKVVRIDLDCSPCFYYSPKPLRCTKREEFKCIRDLPLSAVENAIIELLGEGRRAQG